MHVKPLFTPEQLPVRYWSSAHWTLLQLSQTAPMIGWHWTGEKELLPHWSHGLHDVEPGLSAKDPLWHGLQVAFELPGRPLEVPGVQGMQVALLMAPGEGK